jgi:Zn-dependent metalloprotease
MGVTDYTSQLEYHDQSGALNESFSDIWPCPPSSFSDSGT